MKRKIGLVLWMVLSIVCFSGCGKDPETITDEDLDAALDAYYLELEEDAIEIFEVVGKDRVCKYFEEDILKYASDEYYSSDMVSILIEEYELIYNKFYIEDNEKLDKLVEFNKELDYYIQCQSDVFHKYPFSFYQCAADIKQDCVYVTRRIETMYEETLSGIIQEIYDSFTKEGAYWYACNVVYDSWLGNLPGDDTYVLYSNDLNPFSEAGVYNIVYYADGTSLTIQDGLGFQKEIPVLYLVDENDYVSFMDADVAIREVIIGINNLYGRTLDYQNTDLDSSYQIDNSDEMDWVEGDGFENQTMEEILEEKKQLYGDVQYTLLDIGTDGYSELLVNYGEIEADKVTEIYTYDVECGMYYYADCIPGTSVLYQAEDGKGILAVQGSQGVEWLYHIKEDGFVSIELLSEKELGPDEEYYSNSNPIIFFQY